MKKSTSSNSDSKPDLPEVIVERGTVPGDMAPLAMGRPIMTRFAAKPEWRDVA
ncbi:MAG: hypothetical protein Q7T82_11330 [Armatimonadota bacterium]|nr:hypothetical protein [Armatimonadota bacterium]